MINIKFKKLVPEATIPQKAHASDAGFDMVATKINQTDDYIEYETGIAAAIPEGYVGLLFPRSSNSKKDLLLANAVGVLDSSYRGDIKFRFKRVLMPVIQEVMVAPPTGDILVDAQNTKQVPGLAYRDDHIYQVGDRIGQLIIMPYPEIQFIEVDELDITDRGTGGFGSSGN